MSINLLEELRKQLNLPPLKKVDPNTQEVELKTDKEREYRLMQAIVPAAVAGVYDCARSEAGLKFLTGTSSTPDWLDLFFGNNAPQVKRNLENYTSNTPESVQTHFNSVSAEAVKIIRENAADIDRAASIRNIAGSQRDLFLPYLPAELRIGLLLEDATMDDRMNKMEGPVSTFMHKIETVFTGQESKESADKKRDAHM
ncbi:MAG: hypothetical protein WKF88_03135 [Ferruginibacter sp.]